MYNNIVYFEKTLNEKNNKTIITYLSAINAGLIKYPIIFCDDYSFVINSIPIFHTYYINEFFNKKLILTDNINAKYINNKPKIVLYDSTIEAKPDYDLVYDYNNNNFIEFIHELKNYE